MWAYLEVLEVDPDNATARRQVGKVVTAVRQFDQTAPGRRWQKKLQRQTAFRRWLANWNSDGDGGGWGTMVWFILLVCAMVLGYFIGQWVTSRTTPAPSAGAASGRGPRGAGRWRQIGAGGRAALFPIFC